jgi:DMSO/TMAO reductase YedYZ molybdopterin-dependent catalytic subunit
MKFTQVATSPMPRFSFSAPHPTTTRLRQSVIPVHAILRADGFTPVDAFFAQGQRFTPRPDPALWQLWVQGGVLKPLRLSLGDLAAYHFHEQPCTLYSRVSDRELHIGHARWGGVRLLDLLDHAGLNPAAEGITFYGADAYRVTLPIGQVGAALVATHMNGRPLTAAHGFPARLIVPGLTDAAMPRWLQRIELVESVGVNPDYTVPTTAALLHPAHQATLQGEVQLAGIAFAGDRPIQSVEVRIDDADWMPIPFEMPLSPATWTRWQIVWSPPAPGHYAVAVRAADASGGWSALHHSLFHVSQSHS